MSNLLLDGLRVLELGGKGPVQFTGMYLADLGGDVVNVVKPGFEGPVTMLQRNKRSIQLDLRNADEVRNASSLAAAADVVIEGFRPGVAERLGLGPERLVQANPGLIYGRATGWGQTGPLASTAGHDINYVAHSGILNAIGTADGPPVPPLNLLADFAGGGMVLAAGVLAALVARQRTGRGEVIDASMLDGVLLLAGTVLESWSKGTWSLERQANRLDGGAPWYGVYECADGRFLAVSANEPERWERLLALLGIQASDSVRSNASLWSDMRADLAVAFRRRSSAEWTSLIDDKEACVSLVLSMEEAVASGQLVERDAVRRVGDGMQPAPAPRFSNGGTREPGPPLGLVDTATVMSDWLPA